MAVTENPKAHPHALSARAPGDMLVRAVEARRSLERARRRRAGRPGSDRRRAVARRHQ